MQRDDVDCALCYFVRELASAQWWTAWSNLHGDLHQHVWSFPRFRQNMVNNSTKRMILKDQTGRKLYSVMIASAMHPCFTLQGVIMRRYAKNLHESFWGHIEMLSRVEMRVSRQFRQTTNASSVRYLENLPIQLLSCILLFISRLLCDLRSIWTCDARLSCLMILNVDMQQPCHAVSSVYVVCDFSSYIIPS